jgi:hypothetical protein
MRHSCWRYHSNLKLYMDFMQHACEQGGGRLFFPELSLTGYEATLALKLLRRTSIAHFSPPCDTLRVSRHDPQAYLSDVDVDVDVAVAVAVAVHTAGQ